MRRLMLLLASICFCTFAPVVYADECNYNKLKDMASVIDVQTEIDYDAIEMGIFNRNVISVYGLTEDIYAMADDNSIGFFYNELENGNVSKSIDISSFDSLEIYSVSCPDKKLRTIDLVYQKYNVYADRAECIGLEEKIDVCSKSYDKEITSQEFLSQIQSYKNSLNNSKSDDSDNIFLKIIKEHTSLVIVGVRLLVGLFMFLIIYRMKKNKLD